MHRTSTGPWPSSCYTHMPIFITVQYLNNIFIIIMHLPPVPPCVLSEIVWSTYSVVPRLGESSHHCGLGNWGALCKLLYQGWHNSLGYSSSTWAGSRKLNDLCPVVPSLPAPWKKGFVLPISPSFMFPYAQSRFTHSGLWKRSLVGCHYSVPYVTYVT